VLTGAGWVALSLDMGGLANEGLAKNGRDNCCPCRVNQAATSGRIRPCTWS
jgi:hypothetical protein